MVLWMQGSLWLPLDPAVTLTPTLGLGDPLPDPIPYQKWENYSTWLLQGQISLIQYTFWANLSRPLQVHICRQQKEDSDIYWALQDKAFSLHPILLQFLQPIVIVTGHPAQCQENQLLAIVYCWDHLLLYPFNKRSNKLLLEVLLKQSIEEPWLFKLVRFPG